MDEKVKIREIAQSFRTARMFFKHPCEIAEDAAQQMASWKDKNPSVETIKKIVSYALTKTNIMLSNDLENEVDWELLIKRALA